MKIIVNESLPMFGSYHFSFNGFCLWADTLFRMHIGMANCINSVRNKANLKTKVTKLFIYKQQPRNPSAITLVL